MATIISIHSFRRGTGKSNLVASLATLLAQDSQRVGVVDSDLQSPSLHILFGLDEQQIAHPLNDFLWGKCRPEDTVQNVGVRMDGISKGQLFLVSASSQPSEIARVLRRGFDISLLPDAFRAFVEKCQLDVLMIDNHAGLHEEALISMANADVVLMIMRPDHQDYQGTAVMLDVAQHLKGPRVLLVVNEVPTQFDVTEMKTRMEQTYKCEVAAVLSHSEEMTALASGGVFAVQHPNHPLTQMLKQINAQLLK